MAYLQIKLNNEVILEFNQKLSKSQNDNTALEFKTCQGDLIKDYTVLEIGDIVWYHHFYANYFFQIKEIIGTIIRGNIYSIDHPTTSGGPMPHATINVAAMGSRGCQGKILYRRKQ